MGTGLGRNVSGQISYRGKGTVACRYVAQQDNGLVGFRQGSSNALLLIAWRNALAQLADRRRQFLATRCNCNTGQQLN